MERETSEYFFAEIFFRSCIAPQSVRLAHNAGLMEANGVGGLGRNSTEKSGG
jgi:hypothetical protein